MTGDGPLAIVAYGNGHYLSQQAAKTLKANDIETRVIDMRWIAPMPVDGILAAIDGAEKILIVDECRETGGQSEALLSMLTERCTIRSARLAAQDSFIATGPAYAATMPSRDSIVAAATKLWGQT